MILTWELVPENCLHRFVHLLSPDVYPTVCAKGKQVRMPTQTGLEHHMNANLLVVSTEEYPNPLFLRLEKSGFSCFYSRGVLKTKEILHKQQIDAIVWLFMGHENALGKDLAKIFNQYPTLPIVLITQNYEHLDFAEAITALYANLDLHDDLSDIIRTIETACHQSIIKEQQPESETITTKEIEFKNALSQFSEEPAPTADSESKPRKNKLEQVELWEAVDKQEKQILAGRISRDERKTLLPKRKAPVKKP